MNRSINRSLAAVAVLIAATGVLLFAGDAFVRDQALVYGACAALAFAAALAIFVIPAPRTDEHDAWEHVAWGKFFVALVYASVAAVCLIAMAHTPDAIRIAHEIRTVL